MEWEEFLIVTAYRCGLGRTTADFFIDVFLNESCIGLPRESLAEQFGIQEDSCRGYFTEIFEKVGKNDFQRPNRKRRELYDRLCNEFQKQQLGRMNQERTRSMLPSSKDEQFHLALRNLNYCNQKKAFREALAEDDTAKALLVRVDDAALQRWLVWRLVQYFVELEGIEPEKPCRLATTANRHWAGYPERFWQWLARDIDCNDVCPDSVLDKIVKICETRSVVITIYEVSLLKLHFWDYFLTAFWQPLTERLNSSRRSIDQRRCLLFLTDDITSCCPSSLPYLTNLAWELVLVKDIKLWLCHQQVQEFLRNAIRKSPLEIEQELLQGMSLDRSIGKPKSLIQGIGQDVGLKHGIDEMLHHWELEVA